MARDLLCVWAWFLRAQLFLSATLAIEVDIGDREETRQFYWDYFEETNQVDIGWTGDHLSCDPGETADGYRDSVETQINYFRAMAGVPAEVSLSDELNTKAQEAALLMSKNNRLDHSPPIGWSCYTETAAEAAGQSNLLLGTHGANAISRYIFDPGPDNFFVGHRRWILHPQTQEMGTGDVDRNGFMASANALWVFDGRTFDPRPETRDAFVAWPPAGFVPSQIVYPRWSFGLPDADFAQATVEVSLGGENLPLRVEPVRNGFGDPTIVWELAQPLGGYRPASEDLLVRVSVQDVLVNGAKQDFEYGVTIFDPAIATLSDGGGLDQDPDESDVLVPLPNTNDTMPEVCPGSDFNGDGQTTFSDFLILSANFGEAGSVSDSALPGDTNCDGEVNFDDFLELAKEYQEVAVGGESATVPEPVGAPFCWLAVMVLSLRSLAKRR